MPTNKETEFEINTSSLSTHFLGYPSFNLWAWDTPEVQNKLGKITSSYGTDNLMTTALLANGRQLNRSPCQSVDLSPSPTGSETTVVGSPDGSETTVSNLATGTKNHSSGVINYADEFDKLEEIYSCKKDNLKTTTASANGRQLNGSRYQGVDLAPSHTGSETAVAGSPDRSKATVSNLATGKKNDNTGVINKANEVGKLEETISSCKKDNLQPTKALANGRHLNGSRFQSVDLEHVPMAASLDAAFGVFPDGSNQLSSDHSTETKDFSTSVTNGTTAVQEKGKERETFVPSPNATNGNTVVLKLGKELVACQTRINDLEKAIESKRQDYAPPKVKNMEELAALEGARKNEKSDNKTRKAEAQRMCAGLKNGIEKMEMNNCTDKIPKLADKPSTMVDPAFTTASRRLTEVINKSIARVNNFSQRLNTTQERLNAAEEKYSALIDKMEKNLVDAERENEAALEGFRSNLEMDIRRTLKEFAQAQRKPAVTRGHPSRANPHQQCCPHSCFGQGHKPQGE